MKTKSFIIQARRRKVQCDVHHLYNLLREITLAGGLHLERRRTLHPIYHKLPSSESLLTRPHKRWLHQNIPLLLRMSCVHVGRETTTFRNVAVVNAASVSCFAGYVQRFFPLLHKLIASHCQHVSCKIICSCQNLTKRHSTAVDADAFSATVAHRPGSLSIHPRSLRIPPPLILLRRRPLNEFVMHATMP